MSGRTNRLPLESREALRARLDRAIPPRYSPAFHLVCPSLVGFGIIVVSLLLVRHLAPWQLVAVPAGFLIINAGEWRIHRDVLHKRTPGLQFLYDRHTPEHHLVFLTEDMAIRSSREFRLVLIPPYGVLAAFVAALPLPLLLGLVGQRNLGLLFVATAMAYVISYEWLHLSYHLPADSLIGRLELIALLRRHHATHHDPELMQKWNFNVTIPLWDLVRGTLWRPDRTQAINGCAEPAARRTPADAPSGPPEESCATRQTARAASRRR